MDQLQSSLIAGGLPYRPGGVNIYFNCISILGAGQKPSFAACLHVVLLRGAGILCPKNAAYGDRKGALVQLFIKEGRNLRALNHPPADP